MRELKNGELRIDRARVRAEERLDGKYLLSTTDPSLSAEDVAVGYKQLAEVERSFRTLKSTLDLRPLYHRVPERIEAHVLLCWLALLLVRDEIEQVHRVDLRTKDGDCQVVTKLTERQRKLVKSLKLTRPRQSDRPGSAPQRRRHYRFRGPLQLPQETCVIRAVCLPVSKASYGACVT